MLQSQSSDGVLQEPGNALLPFQPPQIINKSITLDSQLLPKGRMHDRGTGKFAGATGNLTNIGEADLQAGTVFRYSGKVCFADQDQQ